MSLLFTISNGTKLVQMHIVLKDNSMIYRTLEIKTNYCRGRQITLLSLLKTP